MIKHCVRCIEVKTWEEVREIMAKLGYSKLEDMIGQTQHLDVNKRGQHYKSRGLDLDKGAGTVRFSGCLSQANCLTVMR